MSFPIDWYPILVYHYRPVAKQLSDNHGTKRIVEMITPRPEIVLIASKNDDWRGPVEQLVSERLESLTLDPASPLPEALDLLSVKIMVASPKDAKVFAPHFPNLTWIQSTWAGIDALVGHIPESVSVTPLRGVFGQAMSEFVLGWILSLERNIIERAKAKIWDASPEAGVQGKTMGILGTGSIGRAIAAALQPLGIECRGMNSTGLPVPGFRKCFKSGDTEFFTGLDYCVSVLPKTEATNQILGGSAFDAMSNDAIVINVGRGNAIDDEALVQALDNQRLSAAVLDVFATEPLPSTHLFWQHPRIYITSHTAAPTAVDLVAVAMKRNLGRYLSGEVLDGLFVDAKGY